VSVTVVPAPALKLLVLDSGVVHGGGSVGAAIWLNGATPAPMRIDLASSDPTVGLPASVTVSAGANTVRFTVNTGMVRQQKAVSLTASRGTNVVGATLYVVP